MTFDNPFLHRQGRSTDFPANLIGRHESDIAPHTRILGRVRQVLSLRERIHCCIAARPLSAFGARITVLCI
jgi:hypothetical protein